MLVRYSRRFNEITNLTKLVDFVLLGYYGQEFKSPLLHHLFNNSKSNSRYIHQLIYELNFYTKKEGII